MLWAFGHNLKMYHMPILRAYAAYAYDSVAKVKKRERYFNTFFFQPLKSSKLRMKTR